LVSTHRWLHLLGALPVAVRRRRHRPQLGLAGLWLLIAGLALLAGPVARGAVTNLDAALPALAGRSFKAKQDGVTAIANSGDERTVEVLRALLKGDLYYRKDDKRVVLANLGSSDRQARRTAAQALAGSLEPVVRIRLQTVVSADACGRSARRSRVGIRCRAAAPLPDRSRGRAAPALGRPPGLPPTYLGDLSERPSLGSW
jgi:hypothetical protein